MSDSTLEPFEAVIRDEQCYEACCYADEAMATILTAHQAALTVRDAEWVAAIEDTQRELGEYFGNKPGNAVYELFDALLAKFKGGK